MSFTLTSNSVSPVTHMEHHTFQLASPMIPQPEKETDFIIDPRPQTLTPVSNSRHLDIAQPNYYTNYYHQCQAQQIAAQTSHRTRQANQQLKARRKQPIPFSTDEDDYLTFLVQKYGHKNWKTLAIELNTKFLCGRTPEQISQHWFRVVNPQIVKGKWSKEEDDRLIEACRMCPPKQWRQIANLLSGRSDIQVRYRLERLKQSLIASGRLSEEYLP